MDWERTKTVFILAFLLLNAFFMVQLWLMPTYFDSSMIISPRQIEAKLAELQHNNITVTAEVPRRLKPLRMLMVRSISRDPKITATDILGYGTIQVSANIALGHRKYSSDLGELSIHSDGRILYTSSQSGAGGITAAAAQEKAEEFLQNTIGKPRDAKLARTVKAEGGVWVVQYHQTWRNQDLEISRITMIVDQAGVLQMEYYWVDIVGYTGDEVISIPATGALTVAAESLPMGSTITDIYSSWYNAPVQAEQWRTYPVWVIESAKGTKYYVNAITGDLEGREDFPAGKPRPMLN